MLQIIPYLLLFWGRYRNFIRRKYRPYYGFVFIFPLIFVSLETFVKVLLCYTAVVTLDFTGFWRLNFLVFWLPVELHLIPADVAKGEYYGYLMVLVLLSHYLAIDREIDFSIRTRCWREIMKVYIILAIILIPLGFLTGFLVFQPDISVYKVLSFPAIYLTVGYPEELLFRAFLFRVLREYISQPVILLVSSVVFGLAHLNGPSGGFLYFALATVAGLGYGYIYQKTRQVAASAYLHTMVDYTWLLFFGG